MHPGSHDRYQLWRQRLAQKCDQRLLQFVDETHELSKSLVLQFAGAPQTADALQEAFVNIRRAIENTDPLSPEGKVVRTEASKAVSDLSRSFDRLYMSWMADRVA
jgi:hypothetical protein